MVDVGAVARNARQVRADAARGLPLDGFLVDVRPADDVALADYETFCRDAAYAQAQNPVWIRAWVMSTGADAFIVTLHRDGRRLMMLALEVVRKGPFRMASFMGGPHANGNFVSLAPIGDVQLTPQDISTIRAEISRSRPDIDLICLERQLPDFNGVINPFAASATMRSANNSLATNLAGGWDAMLGRMNGKRKRKKYRYTLNKFETMGGYRWIEAGTHEEIEQLISAFYEFKSVRFRKRGISDAFGTPEVQAFFRQLFRDAQAITPPPFVLHGVEVGGQLVGINGYSITGHSFVCEFCAIDDADPTLSPGYFLHYVAMEQACERGKAIYDFSVGDDDYKRSWCDIETQQFDVLWPLTMKGRLAVAMQIARARTISAVKSNKRLWTLAKALRTKIAGSNA